MTEHFETNIMFVKGQLVGLIQRIVIKDNYVLISFNLNSGSRKFWISCFCHAELMRTTLNFEQGDLVWAEGDIYPNVYNNQANLTMNVTAIRRIRLRMQVTGQVLSSDVDNEGDPDVI